MNKVIHSDVSIWDGKLQQSIYVSECAICLMVLFSSLLPIINDNGDHKCNYLQETGL
jgi:hypothetical protein